MQLTVVESEKNSYPLRGILIRNSSMTQCLRELQLLEYSLNDVEIHFIPGNTPNSIWGSLIISSNLITRDKAGRHELCQMLSPNLLIPERSTLFPLPIQSEIEKLFATAKYIAHPDFGWVELTEPVNLLTLIADPEQKNLQSTRPVPPSFVPMAIRSFQVHSTPADEVLKTMEKQVFPEHKKFEDKPLNPLEKLRLNFYKATLAPGAPLEFLGKFVRSFDKKNVIDQDFNDLEERNKKNVDKLLELLKKDPDKALHYAIPLDEGGTTRGGEKKGGLDLSKRWFDFSWNNNRGNSGGSGSIVLGNHFDELRKQYYATAEELIKKEEYQKAAFVYMKLLKNPFTAAETLEKGKYYQDAATIYLKHCNNKQKAAECYEKGKLTMDAIELYKQLENHEKVGDLYTSISDHQQAFIHYTKVAETYRTKNQYIKAALIYKDKMHNPQVGQAMLLQGWRMKADPGNCLSMYFSNIEDNDQFSKDLDKVYSHDVYDTNAESFLDVIKHEYRKREPLRKSIQELAYDLVSKHMSTHPSVVSELKNFNPSNKELFKDTLRYKLSRNLRK